jgi:hypothetical protein
MSEVYPCGRHIESPHDFERRSPGRFCSRPPRWRASAASSYEDLVSFFKDWRAFQKPKVVDGVPHYGPGAMGAQQQELEGYKKRLAAIDPSGWAIPQQVDYQIVRAEVNGLDFDHRVLRPWANNPAFYVTVFSEESDQPAREGPFALGAVELCRTRSRSPRPTPRRSGRRSARFRPSSRRPGST